MVIGIGIDLVETARIEQALARFGDRFVHKLMDPDEAALLPADPAERVLALSFAVAGKEAASKALGTGWSRGVRWRDVFVVTAPAAGLRLEGGAVVAARRLGSGGRTRLRLERRGGLVIAEAWLLS